MVRLLTVKVPNKSDGWDYFFSSLEKAFASEMFIGELKPRVLLCMLGDKVSNILVNLGEEELKDYESLKPVVLKEYEPSPKICLENFRKAKRNSDETFSQFASRLTSMWLYYCKLRGANDFESVNQLIVADKMFEMLDSETATHIGKSYDGPARAKWNDSEKRSFSGSWGKQPFGEKKSDKFSSRKNFDNGKVSTEGTTFEDGTVTARVDLLGKVIPTQDLRVDSGNVDETEVSWGILLEKAQEHIEDSQRNITSCRNEVGTLGTKDEEVTAEMDKGSMVADSFRSERECCAELALVWKHAKEDKGNYYEVDGYLFHRDKILGESIGQLVIPKCRRTEVLRLEHTYVFRSHMSPKTLERIKYSFFWEGLRADVKKFVSHVKIVSSHSIGWNSDLSTENKVLLYTAVMRPILAYASPVWGYAAKTNINILVTRQNSLIRMIVKATRNQTRPWSGPLIANYNLYKDDRVIFRRIRTAGDTAIYCKSNFVQSRAPLPGIQYMDATAIEMKINNFPPLRVVSAYARFCAEINRKFSERDFLKILNSVVVAPNTPTNINSRSRLGVRDSIIDLAVFKNIRFNYDIRVIDYLCSDYLPVILTLYTNSDTMKIPAQLTTNWENFRFLLKNKPLPIPASPNNEHFDVAISRLGENISEALVAA
ncbi:retrovirus-related Pol polyprotein from transposon opus [Trichonephila clavipes]|nr:retrovirus-related Pol polyprotein from transposon opus [Trichonephila clavipes]